MGTREIMLFLRGYAAGMKANGNHLLAGILDEAADKLEDREGVHPDWYDRLSELDHNYNPVKNGEPWYRASDVWACIEETKFE